MARTTEPSWPESGLAYRELHDDQKAVSAFERALELDPDSPQARSNLGVIWFSKGELTRAESAFRESIRLQPDFPDAHANLAGLLSGNGSIGEALSEFQVALRIRPEDAPARYNYALALGRARQFDQAQQQLEAALAADPRLDDAQELLADLLMAKGQTPAALPHYRQAVRLRPESARALLGLGSALADVGDAAGAIPLLQKAAAASDPGVRLEAARILSKLQRATTPPANNPPP